MIIKILRLLFFILIIIFVVWLFNNEKFYREYWLQKKIDKLSAGVKDDFSNSDTTIEYQFYYDN
jgi:hypothetical protein